MLPPQKGIWIMQVVVAGRSHITRGDGVPNKAQTRKMFRHYIHHLLGLLSHDFGFKDCLLIYLKAFY
jgi:hypothetical protein